MQGQAFEKVESVRESTLKLLARVESLEDRASVLLHELFARPEPANTVERKPIDIPPPTNYHDLIERIRNSVTRLESRMQDLSTHLIG